VRTVAGSIVLRAGQAGEVLTGSVPSLRKFD
jgi:hypothetical protein